MQLSNHATIYKYGDPLAGAIRLLETETAPAITAVSPIPVRKKRFKFIPQTFILGGIFGLLIIFSPLISKEIDYRLFSSKEKRVVATEIEIQKESFGNLLKKEGVTILQPIDPLFSLLIPKINLNSRVLANISVVDDDQYNRALKAGVAHAAGTYLPGEEGRIFLFGHSTDFIWNVPRFNAVFYLLKELENGDEIDIVYQKKRYVYQVSDKKIVDPSAVLYLKPKWGREELVLQTCYPPGTTWKRLLIFAQPKDQSLAQN